MRMYNPEWEAIKDFDYTAKVKDLQFDLVGMEIPADHGAALHEEIARLLPWLREIPEAGIHPVHGAPSGRNANLVINRRVKLVLRLPVDRLAAAGELVGKTIDPGAGPLGIGALKEKTLTPYATLYSHFVVLGPVEEAAFLDEASRRLDELGIQAGMIPGKRREMHTPNGVIGGYSLMLHDVSLMQSLTLQEIGLGLHRGYGCGIFIPHKSIKEVPIG
jgi:CRISPR-associated protein Cas6